MTDKIKYSITTSDGKTHEVSKENLDKYGIKAYAESYKGATIRMRDTNGADYDIPLEHYDSATGEGLHAFSIAYSTHTSQAQPPHPEVAEAADDYERRMSGRMPAGWGWRNLGTYGMGGKDLTLPSDAAGADMTGGAPMGKSGEEVGREVAKATAGFMERSGETVGRTRRMAERHTPEGQSKARMAEQRARAMGLDTKLSGLVSPVSGGRGPVVVDKDAPAGAERYGESPQVHDVVMRDGRPAVEWQMQDGSLTSDRVAAEQEEYAQRGARMARETEKRLREEEDRLIGEELDRRGAEARGRRAREYEEEMANAYKRGEDEGWMNYFFRVLGHNPNTQTAAVARGTGLYDDSLRSEEANRIEAEIRTLEEAKKLYDAQHLKRGDGLWDWQNVVNFTQGVRDVVGDVDTYAGGTREAHRVMQMLAIKNKVDAGEELSDADFRLAEAMMLSQKVAASGSTPHGYNAGKTTAEMGRFMIQMAMNPTGNLGRALGTKAFRMLGEKGAKAWAGRIVGTAAGDVASSVFLANTLQAPTTLADAGERHIGEVVTDKDGNLSFVGGDGLLKAFGKAQGAAAIENYTEKLGEYLGVIGDYALRGVGAGLRKFGGGRLVDSISELATKISSTDWARGIADIERKAQWSGPVLEVFEEEAGIALNSIFVGDNKLSDLTDLDQQIDIALGVGLFGGFVSGVKSVGYPVARRRARSSLNTQDGIGRARFGDKWEEIRTAIDSSEDAEVSGVVSGLVNEYAESPMQARTVADYALALMKARGYNLADSAARGDGSMSDEARSVEDSYERGYETRDAQSMNNLKRIYERERSRMASSLGEDDAMKLDAETDMVAILERFRDDEGLRDQAQAYVDARKAYEGMIHRVRDDIDSGIAGSDEEVNLRTNRDTGAVHPAIIRSADGNRKVYVVSGSVVMMDDGVTVDSEKSDKDIIIRDAETGEARFAVAQDVVSLGEAVDAETEKRMAQERIRTEMAREAADRIDGVLQFVPGDVYNVSDGSGGSAEATVVGPVVNNDGSLADGWVRMRYADGSEQDVPKANIEQSVEAAARERVERYATGMGAENPTEGVNMTEKGTPEGLESEGLGVTLQENQTNTPNSENGNGSQQDNGGSIGSERTNAGKGMAVDAAGSVASNRDRGYIRVYEAGLSAERDGNSEYGERARRNSEAERLIGIARQQGQYIDKSVFDSLGKRKSKPSGESVVYINQEQSKVYKVKDPAAKSPMKGNVQPEDVIYEHLVHNKYFPETAYGFEGIGDELGDVRIVLSQDYVDAVDNATDEQIETALAEKGLYPEGNYRYGNDEISVTDVTGDNALVGADGKVYFIDPIIDFKKPIREILPEEDTSDISDVSDIGSDSEVSESALSQIPVDERTGVPMFEQVDADTAWDGVVEFVENEDDAKEYTDSMVEQLTKDVATAEKNISKVKATGDIAKFKAEKVAARQALADAQARLEHWTKVAGVREGRITEEQRQEAEAAMAPEESEMSEVSMASEGEPAVNPEPTEAQKEAGNYKMEHRRIDGMDISIENPKGSTRRGPIDSETGKPKWENEMHNDYGYIRGTVGKDKDHIDIFLSDNPSEGNVFVVDQYNPDGSFDEHKAMYGFADGEAAREAYLANYEQGWENTRRLDVTGASKEEFKKWIRSSKRKTKPFAEYAKIKNKVSASSQDSVAEYVDIKKNPTRTDANHTEVTQISDLSGVSLASQSGKPISDGKDNALGIKKQVESSQSSEGTEPMTSEESKMSEVSSDKQGDDADRLIGWDEPGPTENPFLNVGAERLDAEPMTVPTDSNEAKPMAEEKSKPRKGRKAAGKKFQSELEYIDSQIAEAYERRTDKSVDRKEWDESEEYEAAYNKAADGYRDYIKALADSGELQRMYDKGGIGGRIKIREGVSVAELELDELVDTSKQKEEDKARREAEKKRRMAEVMATIGISPDGKIQKQVGESDKGNREVYEAAKGMLEAAGVRVHEVSDEEAQAMLGRKKETPVAGQPNRANEKLTSGSVLLSAVGDSSSNANVPSEVSAKIIKDTQKAKNNLNKFKNGDAQIDISTIPNLFKSIGSLLSMRSNGGSRYTVLRTDGGNTVAIRLSDHGANGNNFKRDGADENLSIVIERRKYDMPDSEIEFTEAVIPLAVFESRSQDVVAAIVTGVDSVLKDEEFTLPSDLGSVGRKGGAVQKPKFSIRTYHGTGADFDAFDFSHVGEGEGAQAYGWGGYVTEVKGIGRTYATNIAGGTILPKIEKAKENIAQVKRWLKDNGNWEKYSRRERKHQRELEKELKAAEKAGNEKDAEFYRGLLELQAQNLVEDNHRKLIVEKQSQIEEYEKEIYRLEEELSRSRHLYTVRIPDDKGWNYLDWDAPVSDEQKSAISAGLYEHVLSADDEGSYDDLFSKAALRNEIEDAVMMTSNGRELYDTACVYAGTPQAASRMLSGMGLTGIKYPADYRNGGRADGKNNYVLFNEGDMKITDHVRFLRDGDGTVFGWTVGDEVWLNGDAMNPETPLHEYTHLWDAMVRRENPELWARGVELMKQIPVWNEVVNDPNYSDIRENEDEVASEVHARLTGERGADVLERMIDDSFRNGPMAVAEAVTLVDRLKGWLREMFKALKGTLEKWSGKDLSELTAEDFADMTLRDLAEGLNPGEAHAASEGQEGNSFDIERSIEKFKRKYNSAEIVVVKDAAGLDNEDISQESRQGIIEDMEAGETCGLYCRDNGKIYIFAGLQPSITKLYHALLHENIHAIMHRYGREIESELASFRKVAISSINDLAELYEGIRLKYEPAECDEEFFAFVMPLIVLDKSWRNIGKQWAHDENVKKAINFITLKINNGNHERIPQEMDEKIDGDDDRTDRGRGDGSGGVTGRFQGQGDHHGSKAGESGVTDSGEEGRVRFHTGRRGKAVPVHEGSIASEVYEKGVRDTFMHRLDEGWHDYLRSVRIGQEAIEKETGRKLEDSENAYLHALHKSSVDRAELDRAEREVVEPLMDTVRRIRRKHRQELQEIERYMNAKHGPERNRELARRDAVKAVEDSQKPGYRGGPKDFAKEYAKNCERDYSGLTALFDPDGKKGLTVAQLEAEADKAAAAFEAKIGVKDTAELWSRMKALTDRALEKSYTSGRLSKEMFTELSERWQWYVPLRGFREQTADDVYDYIGRDTVPAGATDRKASGRTSEAGDILANAMSMLNSAIVLGNKNEVKQKLLNLALKGETRLLSVSHQWYEKLADGTWQPSYPQIKDGMSADEIRDAIEKHDEMMEAARKNGMAKRKTSEAELPVRTGDERKTEQHAVRVSRNGVEYLVWVNGNPKLAQAVNGLLNFDADKGKFEEIMQEANRRVARNVTALNPDFLSKNFMRDFQNSAAIMAARCGWKYVGMMEANLLRLMGPIITNVVTAKHVGGKRRRERPGMAGLYGRYFKNALDMSRETDRLFSEFMRNGGETGYSQILRPEDYRKRIGKHLRKDGGLGMTSAAGEAFFDSVEVMNRCVENAIRFSAYMTSRQSGKSILRSIEDAKEASVNFNRKGSGAMGNRLARTLYIFVNPAVQGVCQYLGYMSGGKTWRIWPHVALRTVMGAAWPLFASFLYEWYGGGDGDDDDDGYFGIPAYKRRGSLSIPLGDGMWAHVPMTQEQSMFFGIGETVATHFIHNKAGKEDFALAVVSELTKLQPVDFVDVKMFDFNSEESFAKQTTRNLMPTGLKYVADAFIFGDDSFTGRKISRANEFNTNLPEWRRADDDAALKPAMRWLNEKTGGGNSTKGWLNWNPDKWEYALTKPMGGLVQFPLKVYKSVMAASGDDDYRDVRNYPIVGALVSDGNSYARRNRMLIEEVKWWEARKADLDAQVKDARAGGVFEEARVVTDLFESGGLNQYEYFHTKDKDRKKVPLSVLKDLRQARWDAIDANDREKQAAVERELVKFQKEMVEKLRAMEALTPEQKRGALKEDYWTRPEEKKEYFKYRD